MKIAKSNVVNIHYTLKDENNDIMYSSEGREPLTYLHGFGGIIPGLEKELEGQEIGAELSVTIPSEEAYGSRDESLLQQVPLDQFEDAEKVTVGIQIEVESQHGVQIAIVTKIEDGQVTLDMNHPLAGKTLNFDVQVMDVRPATAEEIAHGHVHGPGGHHH